MPDVAWKIFLLVLCLVVAFMMFKNIEIIKLGGPIMVPILLCSFLVLGNEIEYLEICGAVNCGTPVTSKTNLILLFMYSEI